MLQGSFLRGSQGESCLKSKWLSTLTDCTGKIYTRRVELLDPHLASESGSGNYEVFNAKGSPTPPEGNISVCTWKRGATPWAPVRTRASATSQSARIALECSLGRNWSSSLLKLRYGPDYILISFPIDSVNNYRLRKFTLHFNYYNT